MPTYSGAYWQRAADARTTMVAWPDRLTNLASPVRTEVCNPESSHERDDATRFVRMGSRTRAQRRHGRRAIRRVGREQVNRKARHQAPVSWRNGGFSSECIAFGLSSGS